MNVLKPLATVLTFSVSTLNVPLWAFAIPDAGNKTTTAKEIKPVASRKLTDQEAKSLKGKTATFLNPYVSGTSKLSVTSNGVDLVTGNFTTGANDLNFEGGYGIPVNVTRAYSANNGDEGPFGMGWTLSCDMRSTAGGLLKSAGAPNRSVPVLYRDKRAGEEDLRLFVRGSGGSAGGGGGSFSPDMPAESVVSVDASGQTETVQRDADGIWTSPPWEKNLSQPTYETVAVGSALYDVMIANVVTTPDGTVYTYEKMGAFETESNEVPRNILKITKVEDRHGNQTLYEYHAGEVSFIHSGTDWTDTSTERKLHRIRMPDGNAGTPGGDRDLTFGWGNGTSTPANRIISVTDGTRTVSYGYTSGFLTTVTSPGGKVTTYGYGSTIETEESNNARDGILTEITDHRGLTTKIYYVLHDALVAPTNVRGPKGPFATLIRYPNGRVFYLADRSTGHESYWPFEIGEPLDTSTLSYHPFAEYAGVEWDGDEIDDWGTQINHGGLDTNFNDTTDIYTLTMRDPWALQSSETTPSSSGNVSWAREHYGITQDVKSEEQFIYPYENDSLAGVLDMEDADSLYHKILNTPTFNYMGNPLSKTVDEYEGTSLLRTSKVQYAYWGSDKYYQQRATRVRVGVSGGNDVWRYSFTDYFDNEASDGSKGQVKAVYDAKYGTILTTGMTDWRTEVVPTNTGCASATFTYNENGQPITVDKLKTVGTVGTPGTYAYVKTVTEYGGQFGNADKVVEDYGTGKINRTTETLEFDSAGRATEVITGDSSESKKFKTTYLPDGEVQSVVKVVGTTETPVVTYDYYTDEDDPLAANGAVKTVTDELSDVVQTFTYDALGQPILIEEDRGGTGASNYQVAYTYNALGLRAKASYTTPNGTTEWKYDHYMRVGSPENPSNAFQRMTLMDGASETTEQFHYAFDTSGRLTEAAFAQTPSSGSTYDATHWAGKRARAYYNYDPGGKLTSLRHYWDVLSSGSYGSTPLLRQDYTYDSYKGLRTFVEFFNNSGGSWALERSESYAYDANNDMLTGVTYDDDANGLTTNVTANWAYDAAGNRTYEAHGSSPSTDFTYDNLNRQSQGANWNGSSFDDPFIYAYDIYGNRVSRGDGYIQYSGLASYQWDPLNRLTKQVTSETGGAHYTYRADGMRTQKVTDCSYSWYYDEINDSSFYDEVTTVNKPTTRYFYDGQMACEEDFAELVANEDPFFEVTRYGLGARGIDWIEKATIEDTSISFPIYDGHGNVIAQLGRTGSSYSLTQVKRYDVWGGVRSGALGPAGRYCGNLGHVSDDESGLIYMRARYYEPGSGRFVSEDPAMDGQNWYAYCGNDPVGRIDFTGMWECEIGPLYFRIDTRSPGIDMHVKLGGKNGRELFSRQRDGLPWHGEGGGWTQQMTDAIVNACHAGNREARNLARRIAQYGYGLADDVLHALREAAGLFVIFAYTSVDAYMQYDPVDFADLMSTIFSMGRS